VSKLRNGDILDVDRRVMRIKPCLAALFFVSISLQACGSSSHEVQSSTMHLEKRCRKTHCDVILEIDGQSCSRCLSACFASDVCDSTSACKASCGPSRGCSEAERNECTDSGYVADLPKTASPELEKACDAAVRHFATCGWSVNETVDCRSLSAVERPELAERYDCMAQVPCEAADLTACNVAPTTFGDELCGEGAKSCPGLCTDDVRQMLNAEGAWLRTDVLDAARQCVKADACSDVSDCLRTWLAAVMGR
jgi:hypothetical protein